MRLNPWFKERSRALRTAASPAERILWPKLRGRRFAGLKFRRQHVIESFIVDFYCAEISLILEIDGETHLGKEQLDQARQRCLEGQGHKVLRFWNTDIYDDLEVVLEAIWRECDARCKAHNSPWHPYPKKPPHPQPLAPEYRGEGGRTGAR
jgi:very-short-patch-repair endonuclease